MSLIHPIELLLISLKENASPGYKEDALQNLKERTGQDFGYDGKKWRRWLTENGFLKPRQSQPPLGVGVRPSTESVTEEITQQDLAYLGSRGMGATDAADLDGSVRLHRFSRDGILRWLWTDSVPPGTAPVTQPSDDIAKTRQIYGWEEDRPVYGCDGGVLRLMRQGEEYVLDNAILGPMADCPATFVWRFNSLEQAVDAAIRYFTEVAAGINHRRPVYDDTTSPKRFT
jgi:hypothetical protein